MIISSSLLHYRNLSPAAKAVARSRVMAFEESQYKKMVDRVKKSHPVSNINKLVNDPYHIQRLIHKLQAVRKYQHAPQCVIERYIEENLCMFDAAGRYYLFIEKTFY